LEPVRHEAARRRARFSIPRDFRGWLQDVRGFAVGVEQAEKKMLGADEILFQLPRGNLAAASAFRYVR